MCPWKFSPASVNAQFWMITVIFRAATAYRLRQLLANLCGPSTYFIFRPFFFLFLTLYKKFNNKRGPRAKGIMAYRAKITKNKRTYSLSQLQTTGCHSTTANVISDVRTSQRAKKLIDITRLVSPTGVRKSRIHDRQLWHFQNSKTEFLTRGYPEKE